MKKLDYEVPEMEVVWFESEDIICASGQVTYDPSDLDALPFISAK